MKNKKGFTLLELLIAATILGLLAVFATISYRDSVVENRVAAAKVKVEQLARGMQRFALDYSTDLHGLMGNLTDSDIQCQPYAQFPKTLITCGYVDNGGWTDPYMEFYVCNGKTADCAASSIAAPLACMKGRNHPRLPERYRGSCGYLYCVGKTESGERLGGNGAACSSVAPGGGGTNEE